jgi:hypothetical protein
LRLSETNRAELMRLLLALSIFVAIVPRTEAVAADQVPSIDISRNCGFEAEGGSDPRQTKAHCVEDEKTAKQQLSREWSKFDAGLKRQCMGLTATGGEQSYVELQTCLEMSSDNAGNNPVSGDTSNSAHGKHRTR